MTFSLIFSGRRRAFSLCRTHLLIAILGLLWPTIAAADESNSDAARLNEATVAGLSARGIGPALTSGRISDIAIHPSNKARWIVAVASGGVWETENAGTTWKPLFDSQNSYSIGCIAIDPNDPNVIWVGTGENNSQRSVSYGDGVYKSIDGGATWQHVGLGASEHIGKILIDPRDSNVVWVAAQGPLWNSGGERGVYKSTDGGTSWDAVLTISEDTGATDIVFDPRNPDVVYAATYQRRRHVWVLLNGGPESAVYKTVDAGRSWTKLEKGLPTSNMGRVGLAVSPVDPSTVYAIVEAQDDQHGFYRSKTAGASWEKRSDYVSSSPQYYQEIVADPADVDRVYSVDTWLAFTDDGGATFTRTKGTTKHVDDHALWIDPDDPRHIISGNDGGIYESWDRGTTWRYIANLPVTQFYRVTADNDFPFYNVYGGTQDNATLGGPSRTISPAGIANDDWYVTVFGDGYKTQIDPTDPNVVYSQWQYGGLVRFDRRTREIIDIQPQAGPKDAPLRWNWNSPLIISAHSNKRLYFAAQKLFRSDDRGNSWTAVSGDLTRNLDRNTLDVFGRVWSVDSVAKNKSTSFYGNIVSLSESPLVSGLLYVGTDDGLIQVSEDSGGTWRKVASVRGVPEMTYVSHLEASFHDPDTLFVSFDNHKRGDFKPYVLTSRDRGKTWKSIRGDLPDRGSVHVIKQDHVDPRLLFVGTEFGAYFSSDGGERWVRISGLPTIAVRDLDIQRRESDLVIGTFGRGIYILDDYSPLRGLNEEVMAQEAVSFSIRTALAYIERSRLVISGKGFLGDGYFLAPNPPFGAVFTYYLRDDIKTARETRRDRERKAQERGEDNSYPSWEELRKEDREQKPTVVLVVSDSEGRVVRRIRAPTTAGFHRVAWDLRYPAPDPTRLEPFKRSAPWSAEPLGPMVMPGTFSVSFYAKTQAGLVQIAEPRSFEVVPLGLAVADPSEISTADRREIADFQKRSADLQRAILAAAASLLEVREKLRFIDRAIEETPRSDEAMLSLSKRLRQRLDDLSVTLNGDSTVASRNEPTLPSLVDRIGRIVESHWATTSPPTTTHRENLDVASAIFHEWLPAYRKLVTEDLSTLEQMLEEAGAPWTPGRVPQWPH